MTNLDYSIVQQDLIVHFLSNLLILYKDEGDSLTTLCCYCCNFLHYLIFIHSIVDEETSTYYGVEFVRKVVLGRKNLPFIMVSIIFSSHW